MKPSPCSGSGCQSEQPIPLIGIKPQSQEIIINLSLALVIDAGAGGILQWLPCAHLQKNVLSETPPPPQLTGE